MYDPTAQDDTPPTITLASHTPDQTVSTPSQLIQVTATDANGISGVTINGSAAVLNMGRYEQTVTLVQGSNTIRVYATDNSSNQNQDSLVFSLIYTPLVPDSIYLFPADSATDTTIDVRWTKYANTQGDFEMYMVYYSLSPDVSTSDVLAGSITNINDTDLTIGGLQERTTYYIKVFVEKSSGSDLESNEIQATTQNRAPDPVTVSISSQGVSTLTLSWGGDMSTVPDFLEYRAYLGAASTFDTASALQMYRITNITQTTQVFAGLLDTTLYYFKFYVVDSGGLGGISSTSGHTMNAAPPACTLSIPTRVGEDSMRVSWTQSTAHDFTRYRLVWGTTSTVDTVVGQHIGQYTDTNITTTWTDVKNLLPARFYYFKLYVYDNTLVSPSNVISRSTKGWHYVGGQPFATIGRVNYVSLDIGTDGSPYVAFQDGSGTADQELGLLRFYGNRWSYVGGGTFSDWLCAYPSLAMDGDVPYVAYSDGGANNYCTVHKYDGGWKMVGPRGFSGERIRDVDIKVHNRVPMVVYRHYSTGTLTAREFRGITWSLVGAANFTTCANGPLSLLALAIDPEAGVPYVAFKGGSAADNGRVTVSNMVMGVWKKLVTDNGYPSTGPGNYISMVIKNSQPIVAFRDDAVGDKIVVKKVESSAWKPLEASGSLPYIAGDNDLTSLAVERDNVYVAFRNDTYLTVQQLEPVARVIGGLKFNTHLPEYISIAAKYGRLYVAYSALDQGGRLVVMEYY
jgi:hypothetical protein